MKPASQYFLARECFLCKVQSYWIILNTVQDRYLCMTQDDFMSVAPLLHGWRAENTVQSGEIPSDDDVTATVNLLIENNVLTDDPGNGKPFSTLEGLERKRSIDAPTPFHPLSTALQMLPRFVMCCLSTDRHLRTKPLSFIIDRIRRRNACAKTRDASGDRLRSLIRGFTVLRPLYPRPYLCLFDSLALLEFLARNHVFAQLVFGVVADPFEAHCWLQKGTTVLNDEIERLYKYRPILAV